MSDREDEPDEDKSRISEESAEPRRSLGGTYANDVV